MIRSLQVLGVLGCLTTIALVFLIPIAGAVRPGYAALPSAPEAAPVEGALVGAVALGDLASLPVPNGP